MHIKRWATPGGAFRQTERTRQAPCALTVRTCTAAPLPASVATSLTGSCTASFSKSFACGCQGKHEGNEIDAVDVWMSQPAGD